MSTVWLDGAIGETRYVLANGETPFALVITRWSDAGRRARWGEVYVGRVRSVERSLRGAFVDLGLKDEQGFLPLDANGHAVIERDQSKHPVREGQTLTVRVAREGLRGKGPVLALVAAGPDGAPLARVERHEDDVARDDAQSATPEIRERIDATIEEALSARVALPGGGVLTIEPTTALTAIDVDAATRKGPVDPERFARDLNVEAARHTLRQLRLRAQGGLAVIDFVSMRRPDSRQAVEAELKAAAASDPWGARLAPISRFGLVELSRAQYMRPVRDVLLDLDGRKSVETVALETLRAIEREAATARGRQVVAGVATEIADWLNGDPIPWREALNARAGARWEIEIAKGAPRERLDVRAV